MREILFRAKAKDDGMWIEGFPVRIYDYGGLVWDMHPFNTNFEITRSIDPKTIGQFTGLTDKNGKKIFEGDILKAIAGNPVGEPIVAKVVPNLNDYELMWDIEHSYELEIIGNIHDNPELLGGAEDGKSLVCIH